MIFRFKIILFTIFMFISQIGLSASKVEIDAQIDEVLIKLYDFSPAAKTLASKAEGILVFPNIVKAGWVIGGSYGEGALRVNDQNIQYYNNISGSVGFQFGVEKRSEVIIFLDKTALISFQTSDGWDGGADGSVAIATFGTGEAYTLENIKDPIVSFIFSPEGLMVNASLEGTKISKIKTPE